MFIELINKIKLYLKKGSFKVEEPLFSLPISYITSYLEAQKKGESSFKYYAIPNSSLFGKIKVDKISIDSSTFLIIFSGFYKKIKLLKYNENNYDFFIKEFKRNILVEGGEDYLEIDKKENYENLEKLFFEEKDNEKRECILDFVFKNYPEKLFDLKDGIFSNDPSFDYYIRKYYSKLLILLFEYTNYDKLVEYYNDLESFYSEDKNIEELKEILITHIQEKNLLEQKIKDINF